MKGFLILPMAWSPAAWSALAAWTGVLIAGLVGLIALKQVKEARRLREEQARPYVVAYMEATRAPEFVELVVRNFGKTIAHDIRMTADPPLMRSGHGGKPPEEVVTFEVLSVLVPGQEWRTHWDYSTDRRETELPDVYRIRVDYSDSHGKAMPSLTSTLDWRPYKGRIWLVSYGLHEAADALRKMAKTFTKWQESPAGLAVFVRDGDAKDQEVLAAHQEQLAAQKALLANQEAKAENQPPDSLDT